MRLREVEVQGQVPLPALLKPAAISNNDFFEWNPALGHQGDTGWLSRQFAGAQNR